MPVLTNLDLRIGDCLESLRTLPDGCVQTCVTSPPYFGLRDYGHEGQIGLEDTPDAFVAKLVEMFREVRRVLRDDGTLWLNLGDSYSTHAAGKVADPMAKSTLAGVRSQVVANESSRARGDYYRTPGGLPEKNLIGIPWRVAFALQADGWYLRQDIIWSKPNPMPESVRDRCTKAHEYIFLLSKGPRYYFDAKAIAEPLQSSSIARLSQATLDQQAGSSRVPGKTNGNMKAAGPRFGGNKYGDHDDERNRTKSGNEWTGSEARNRRSVWTVTTKPYGGAHFATFPPDLIEPCILAGAPEGGVVLDPFGGSGTTAGVALAKGRKAILCELNPKYAALVPARVASIMAEMGQIEMFQRADLVRSEEAEGREF
jgi:DNA modification methylase